MSVDNARRRIVAGNWKMYKTRREGRALVEEILTGAADLPCDVHLLVFPPATAMAAVAEKCAGTRIEVGGQNLHPEPEGAFTGEISARMILEAGATHVLIGHSERRHIFGEQDELLARKLRSALEAGLRPVFCVGETLEERDSGRTEEVLGAQIAAGLTGLKPGDLGTLILAYEPVWAIGTGRTATANQARDAHAFLRRRLEAGWGAEGRQVPVLYGGSVKPENAAELMGQQDVDGVLVGGASLNGGAFVQIARGAGL